MTGKDRPLKLFQFPRMFDIPNLSPFCCKLETWLRIAGIPYEIEITTNPRKGPRGKLPFVDDGGVIVADTTIIIDHLKRTRRRSRRRPGRIAARHRAAGPAHAGGALRVRSGLHASDPRGRPTPHQRTLRCAADAGAPLGIASRREAGRQDPLVPGAHPQFPRRDRGIGAARLACGADRDGPRPLLLRQHAVEHRRRGLRYARLISTHAYRHAHPIVSAIATRLPRLCGA
jgi:hypothetical protein